MASVVDICNLALSLLGQKTIVSLEDETPEAYACRLHWPLLRNSKLRGHNWNCAKKKANLNRLNATPAFGFRYYYQLPSDCLFVQQTYPEDFFEIEGRKLLSDQESVGIDYVSELDDSTVYDAQLVAAFGHLLASELCPQMQSSSTEAARLLSIGKELLLDAKASDGLEGKMRETRNNRWLTAKYR